jgi:hypothetical protein
LATPLGPLGIRFGNSLWELALGTRFGNLLTLVITNFGNSLTLGTRFGN